MYQSFEQRTISIYVFRKNVLDHDECAYIVNSVKRITQAFRKFRRLVHMPLFIWFKEYSANLNYFYSKFIIDICK